MNRFGSFSEQSARSNPDADAARPTPQRPRPSNSWGQRLLGGIVTAGALLAAGDAYGQTSAERTNRVDPSHEVDPEARRIQGEGLAVDRHMRGLEHGTTVVAQSLRQANETILADIFDRATQSARWAEEYANAVELGRESTLPAGHLLEASGTYREFDRLSRDLPSSQAALEAIERSLENGELTPTEARRLVVCVAANEPDDYGHPAGRYATLERRLEAENRQVDLHDVFTPDEIELLARFFQAEEQSWIGPPRQREIFAHEVRGGFIPYRIFKHLHSRIALAGTLDAGTWRGIIREEMTTNRSELNAGANINQRIALLETKIPIALTYFLESEQGRRQANTDGQIDALPARGPVTLVSQPGQPQQQEEEHGRHHRRHHRRH